MTEAAGFAAYHVLMWRKGRVPRLGIPLVASWSVWGSDVQLGRWVQYDGDVLRSRYRERWQKELSGVLELPFLEVLGEGRDGQREVLAGRTGASLAGSEGTRIVPRPGRPAGSGLGVYVRHLRDNDGLEYVDILPKVLASGDARFVAQVEAWGEADVGRLAGLRRLYAGSRTAHDAACPKCKRRTMAD